MRYNDLPEDIRKACGEQGGYLPYVFTWAQLLGEADGLMLCALISVLESPEKYQRVSQRVLARKLNISPSTASARLESLRQKNVVRVRTKDDGKTRQARMYKVDWDELRYRMGLEDNLSNIRTDDDTNLSNIRTDLSRSQPLYSNEEQSVETKQNKTKAFVDLPAPAAQAWDPVKIIPPGKDAHAARRSVWEPLCDKYAGDLLHGFRLAVQNRFQIGDAIYHYVLYFVLQEQWQRTRDKRGREPDKEYFFVNIVPSFLQYRWIKLDAMWAYDELAARIADGAGILRDYTLEASAQRGEAAEFRKLYKALLSYEYAAPESAFRSYIFYLEERADPLTDTEFESTYVFDFRKCATPQTVKGFDEEYTAPGKTRLLQYFNHEVNLANRT